MFPLARYFLPRMENWEVYDPNSRLNSVTDQDGYVDVDVSGGSASGDEIYFSTPIKDLLYGAGLRGSDLDTYYIGVRSQFHAQPAGTDILTCGWTDTPSNPPSGAFSGKGIRHNTPAGNWNAVNHGGGGGYQQSASFSLTLPFATGHFAVHRNAVWESDDTTLWSDASPPGLQVLEDKFGGLYTNTPTHLTVIVWVRGGAQTLQIKPGFFVLPSLGDIDNVARAL